MAPRTGRPPKENPKNERITIRATPEEKEKIMRASRELEVPLLELLKQGIEAVKRK